MVATIKPRRGPTTEWALGRRARGMPFPTPRRGGKLAALGATGRHWAPLLGVPAASVCLAATAALSPRNPLHAPPRFTWASARRAQAPVSRAALPGQAACILPLAWSAASFAPTCRPGPLSPPRPPPPSGQASGHPIRHSTSTATRRLCGPRGPRGPCGRSTVQFVVYEGHRTPATPAALAAPPRHTPLTAFCRAPRPRCATLRLTTGQS